MTDAQLRRRILLFQGVILLSFVVLTVQLWRMQILGGAEYQKLAAQNSIRSEVIDAPRGVIYDRQGRILVRNRPSFRATLIPAHVLNETWLRWSDADWEQAAASLGALAADLDVPYPTRNAGEQLRAAFQEATGDLTLEQIDQLCQEGRLMQCFAEALIIAPYNEVTVQEELSQEVAFRLMENSINLPGLTVVSDSQREYPYGPLYSHIIGYGLPVPQHILDSQTRLTANPYLPNDRIGTAGLEAGYEAELRGVRGYRLIEENVVGQAIRVIEEQPGIPGHNLFLTIDTELQRVVTEALARGMEGVGSKEGVAIVMNPNTGEILAMVSLPTYDNNAFVGTIDPEVHQQLIDDPMKPMFNRAISGTYPPGSIFKIVPAAGALADGVITRDTVINDPGVIYLPNENISDPELAMEAARPFVCWLETGHGDENVVEALAHSCDVFFYEVGGGYLDQFEGLGIDRLAKWASAFGLGAPTRIRLPGEAEGHVPSRQWKRLVWQQSWVTGDTYNMSIGQGFLTVTPLQMLNATIAVANGGTIYEPQLVYQIQDPTGHVKESFEPRVLRHVNVPPEYLALVREGMRGAAAWDDGTANLIFKDSPVPVAGKTGTAEYCEWYMKEDGSPDCKLDANGNQLTHAWFTAFAPYENPEIALIVFVHGNEQDVIQGSEIAAPIAREIIDYYFRERPLESLQAGEMEPTPTVEATLTPTPLVLTGDYRPIFINTEGWPNELSAVVGEVIDRDGNPIPGVTLTIDRGGSPVATVTTDSEGRFIYENLSASQSLRWYVRAEVPGRPYVYLDVAPYSRYNVRFEEVP